MTRTIGKLSALAVSRIKKKGLYSDGGGLYLRVKEGGGKFWMLRYMLDGKAREMGLGALHALTLAEARDKATDCRRLLASKIDPIATRNDAETQKKVESAKSKTFKECAEAYIEAHEKGWRNAKHAQQWKNTLTAYAYPIMGDVPVQDIDLTLITKILEQKKRAFGKGETLWTARPETASRVRGRIEVILDWATTRQYRKGENPARWRGHLANLLPNRSKVQRVKHHPALPYERIGVFFAALKEQDMNTAVLAMQFTILTGCRTGECLGATWGEIDWDHATWNIPAMRTKTGCNHRAALSNLALELLKKIRKDQENNIVKQTKEGFIFVGQQKKPLSDMSMLAVIRRMNEKADNPVWVDPQQDNRPIVVHGFRSTFRDWAAEQTNFPRDAAEAALAHAVGDKTEAAYRRSDLFNKRRLMMEAWAKYCATPPVKAGSGNKVVSINKR